MWEMWEMYERERARTVDDFLLERVALLLLFRFMVLHVLECRQHAAHLVLAGLGIGAPQRRREVLVCATLVGLLKELFEGDEANEDTEARQRVRQSEVQRMKNLVWAADVVALLHGRVHLTASDHADDGGQDRELRSQSNLLGQLAHDQDHSRSHHDNDCCQLHTLAADWGAVQLLAECQRQRNLRRGVVQRTREHHGDRGLEQ